MGSRRTPRRLDALVLALAAVLLVSACGQKGPLFLPEEGQEEEQEEREARRGIRFVS